MSIPNHSKTLCGSLQIAVCLVFIQIEYIYIRIIYAYNVILLLTPRKWNHQTFFFLWGACPSNVDAVSLFPTCWSNTSKTISVSLTACKVKGGPHFTQV